MAEILELAYQEYKTAMINMLRAAIEKVDRIQEQMSNVSRQMDTLRKNEKEMVEIKNTMTEMKNPFYGLISRLDTTKERIIDLKAMAIIPPKLRKKEEKK